MDAFDFLNDIVQWFGKWVPRWDLLQPDEGGIKFRPRTRGIWPRRRLHKTGNIIVLEPGEIYWYWPVTSYVVTIDTKRQTLAIGQRLTTKDGVSVQVDTVIVFVIDDVEKALVETKDFKDTIGEVAQKLTIRPIMSRTFAETCEDMGESNNMRNEIFKGAKALLGDYGVRVLDGYVSDFAKTTVFSHDGEMGFAGHDHEEEEE